MDREQLLRLVVAERFAPNGRATATRTRAVVREDDDLTTARRRRELCDALDDTTHRTRKAAA